MSEREETVRLRRCSEHDDPRALIEHGIAAMVRVTRCDDPQLALKAGQWLIEYGERFMKAKEETASAVSPDGSARWRVC
jgi:hypothetical protein